MTGVTGKGIPSAKRLWLALAFAFIYTVFITFPFEHLVSHSLLHVDEINLSLVARFFHFFPRSTYVPHEPKHTALLELGYEGESGEPQLTQDTCGYRNHVAEALEGVAMLAKRNSAPVGVIVDMRFDRRTVCHDSDARLVRAGETLLQRVGPVFFGASVAPGGRDLTSVVFPCGAATAQNYNRMDVDSCGLPFAGGVGVVSLPEDLRKLTLLSCRGAGCIGDPQITFPTLVFNAALTRPVKILDTPGIAEGLEGHALYHFVLKRDAWNRDETRFTWSAFQKRLGETDSGRQGPFSGKWLIIGSSEDLAENPAAGDEPGYFHHASALEAVIEKRLLRPVPAWVEWSAALFFWVFVEFLGAIAHHRWPHSEYYARLLLAALGGVLLVGVSVILVYAGGRYSDFSLISVFGFAILVLESITKGYERLRHRVEAGQ